MREIKPVEVRKKEILEAAVKVFQEKGYDRTSISDIARSLHISQGLCYRYFRSKEEIFESALDSYAQYIADKMIAVISSPKLTLQEKITNIPDSVHIEKENKDYYEMFHGQGTVSFHDRLSLEICRKITPYVKKLLQEEVKNGRIKLDDPDTTAYFVVFGQLGILLDQDMTRVEKNNKIMEFLLGMFEDKPV